MILKIYWWTKEMLAPFLMDITLLLLVYVKHLTREELDEVFDMMACGGLDPNTPEDDDKWDYAALHRYCKTNKKVFDDLTPEEIEMFRIKP